jgi:thiol-disulfide isomerase/thioredoxin
MKRTVFILAILFFLVTSGKAQQIRAVTAADVMARASSGDTTYIINFWATWCVPCVQELPEFNQLYDRYKDKPVKIVMVSLDFKDSYPYKLEGFLRKKRISPEVVWLMDTDPNVFIPRIEEEWQGSIPATLIIRPGRYRKFVEGQVTVGQVISLVAATLEN